MRTGGKMNYCKMLLLICSLLIITGCTTSVSHVTHESLIPEKDSAKNKNCILVADIGDTRDNGAEDKDKIGFGFSYWLPIGYNLRDSDDKTLYASHFIANSIVSDLKYLGYDATLLNQKVNTAFEFDSALAKAKESQCSYLVTSNLIDAKTNYWGFILIPFMEPVWTRLGLDLQVVNLKQDTPPDKINVVHDDTEWYFGKITIFDAIFDAGLFGGHWVRTAWGETVVPEGIAKGVLEVHKKINVAANTAK